MPENSSLRRGIRQGIGAIAWLSAAATALAAYPDRPIRIEVPAGVGGPMDSVARALGQEMALRLKQPVIVENRTGAGGIIAAGFTAVSAPDGYTLLVVNDQVMMGLPLLTKKMPYDTEKAFTGVSMLMETDLFVIANASLPASDMKGIEQLARSQPVSVGTYGDGSPPQLFFSIFNKQRNSTVQQVPYRGTAQVTQALLANEVQLAVTSWGSSNEYIKTGRLKPIAALGKSRSKLLPEVPTIAEAGYAGLEMTTWFGLVAPAGCPKAVIDTLNATVQSILNDPKFATEQLNSRGWNPWPTAPGEIAATVKRQQPSVTQMIKAAGLEAQ